jgi:Domain of unknown function (DUF4372)
LTFKTVAFAQLGEKKSLSATVFALSRMESKLYHMGIRGKVAKSTLADANNKRDGVLPMSRTKKVFV